MERSFICRLDIGRSRYLLIYLLIVHLIMTLTLVMLFADIGWLVVIILISMAMSLIFHMRKYGWLLGGSTVKMISCDEYSFWTVNYSDEDLMPELQLKSSFVTPLLTLIRLNGEGFLLNTTIVIIADAVDTEQFRQLRVMLRDPKTFQK